MIKIYNTLTRRKEKLTPRIAGELGIYVCGMTVYDYCHLGHARVLVVFDTIVRYLRATGLKVKYIRNITDIDDKIIQRAAENGEPFNQLTDRFIRAMHEDCLWLGVLPPDDEPRATAHIGQILQMITTLIERDFAYSAANGDVYYRVRQFPQYGRLSGKTIDQLQVGARVERDHSKEDPLDFVLWKGAKPGEPSWESPWGEGRPGWHIECSAMSTHCLGNHFDIHGGGMDLQFPHHENEIAQSESASGEHFVNLWMHNGYVQIDQEKMSKSLGNFFTIREILKTDNDQERMGEVIRYMILGSHYRSPLNFSDSALKSAKSALTRLYLALEKTQRKESVGSLAADIPGQFHQAMSDDFNTPGALAALFDLVREVNRAIDDGRRGEAKSAANELKSLGALLGILQQDPGRFLGSEGAAEGAVDGAEIDQLVADRNQARADRDWQKADLIRDDLLSRGILLEDAPDGSTRWRLA